MHLTVALLTILAKYQTRSSTEAPRRQLGRIANALTVPEHPHLQNYDRSPTKPCRTNTVHAPHTLTPVETPQPSFSPTHSSNTALISYLNMASKEKNVVPNRYKTPWSQKCPLSSLPLFNHRHLPAASPFLLQAIMSTAKSHVQHVLTKDSMR